MWVRVNFAYSSGVKLRTAEAHPRGTLEGELQSYSVGRTRSHVVSLRFDVRGPDLAQLYAVQLAGISNDVLPISGLERGGDAWVRQEWICELYRSMALN
jgi:hypothetical protein